ncbi:MAG: hypothetical protein WCE46_05360 [Methanoregula sp.]|jgi:hypothetical protein|uniref:hypothetical protein n=1 Tax=Methanoregula sp. TaxID=2052170 RepID=UPI003C76F516
MSNRTALVFVVFVCLAAILVAGCTSSTASANAQTNTGPAATMTQVSTSGMVTPAAAQGTTAAASQDPIVGKWSTPTVKGYSAQVVFGADGSFTGYLNGGSQVMKSGTWQSAGSGKYTITISGTAAPVNWVFEANTNVAYDTAYPSIVYSRMS